jgi:hypothetical protein
VGSSGLELKSSQELVLSLSDRVTTIKIKSQIKSFTEGREPRNAEVRKFKQEAIWQSIRNHGKESNEVKKAQITSGIEAQGKKRTSVT